MSKSNLKFGLTGLSYGPNSFPEKIIRGSQAAERAGFESIWAGGHPFLSEKQNRFPTSMRILDPIVALTFVAANTKSVRLGTGVLLLPQFDPLIMAKELASLDVLSGGRLVVGVGVGWSEHEYEALRLSFHDRGRRVEEYLRAIEVIWREDKPAFKGRFLSFGELTSFPHPVQQPHPPIIIGGYSPDSFRRAVQQGNGWYGFGLTVEDASKHIASLREAEKKYGRPPELGELEITVTPKGPVDRFLAEQYSKVGVHRLVLPAPASEDFSETEHMIASAGDSLIGKV